MRDAIFVSTDLLLQCEQGLQTGGRIGRGLERLNRLPGFGQAEAVGHAGDQHACGPYADDAQGDGGKHRDGMPAHARTALLAGDFCKMIPYRQVGAI